MSPVGTITRHTVAYRDIRLLVAAWKYSWMDRITVTLSVNRFSRIPFAIYGALRGAIFLQANHTRPSRCVLAICNPPLLGSQKVCPSVVPYGQENSTLLLLISFVTSYVRFAFRVSLSGVLCHSDLDCSGRYYYNTTRSVYIGS